jgi:3-phenylpropionate/trans-cinnamate dioxygenase ferredoxin subunit
VSTLPFEKVALLADLHSGEPAAVSTADGEQLCLVREGEKVYALSDRCPHRDFALSGGDMVNSHVLECPWHGARFDCRTGRVMQGPATEGVTTYQVRIVAGEVFVGPRRLASQDEKQE